MGTLTEAVTIDKICLERQGTIQFQKFAESLSDLRSLSLRRVKRRSNLIGGHLACRSKITGKMPVLLAFSL